MTAPHTPHVLVVGSGIAGLVAAMEAADNGCRVTLATKSVIDQSNTRYAQGGIASALFAGDSAESHAQDTLTAGAGLSDPETVAILTGEGPARIHDLVRWGVGFDRDADGEYVQGLEAAHSAPRILHAGGDATGAVIQAALVAAIERGEIEILEHAFLSELTLAGGRVSGANLLVGDPEDPTILHVTADAVVLATGGAGQLYSHTTNPSIATADGIAAALRAGAEVDDLEFVQFHPTVLAAGEPFLISEAVRGEGAILIDDSGERFTFDAHPDGELAPRDVVARAIDRAMARQGGRAVRLDATALDRRDPGFLARRFPTIDRAVRERGLDWTREPIPVTPAAHYLMGGVRTDAWGRTTVAGLYAVGEVARTGVHGANRLASNSLLEGAVFGARTGRSIATDLAAPAAPVLPSTGGVASHRSVPTIDPETVGAFTREALQDLLWTHAGLVRDEEGLQRASDTLALWRSRPRLVHSVRDHENENLLDVAMILVDAARERTTSVGAHFRADLATSDPASTDRIAVTAC